MLSTKLWCWLDIGLLLSVISIKPAVLPFGVESVSDAARGLGERNPPRLLAQHLVAHLRRRRA
jgi:hypothetical protein